jgi:uncharacterized membrane-anchored protein
VLNQLKNLSAKTRAIIALAAGIVILAAVNYTIVQREQLLSHGRIVLLELAPVDPRSLMQGDYMALRFALANDAFSGLGRNGQIRTTPAASAHIDGQLVAALNEHGVGQFRRFATANEHLASNEVLLRYRIRNDQVKFATNAFFFQEGHASLYEKARFGEFRVAADGEMILTSLRSAEYVLLEAPKSDAGH